MTALSNRQYPCLKLFARQDPNWIMDLAEAATLDQRPFRSLLMRGWIEYVKPHGFRVTKSGLAAWREFHQTDIVRQDPLAPSCAYFYALAGTGPAKIRPTRKPPLASRAQMARHAIN